MRKRKSLLPLVFISIFSLVSLLYLVLFFPPKFSVPLYAIEIPILPIVLFAVFIFIWSAFWYILANKRHAFFIATAVLIILILRALGLKQALFPILVIIFFFGFEALFKEKNKL